MAILLLICLTGNIFASDEDIAKKLQNPVADLISVPFQMNFDRDLRQDDKGERFLMNIQPVVPIELTPDWKLINRLIAPVISQTNNPTGTQNGLGDLTYEGFISPATSSKFIWGVGPVIQLRTGTARELTSGKTSVGPTAVGLMQHGPWTYGILAFHDWSIAGDQNRDEVNQTYLQPFFNHTNQKAFTLGASLEHTINHVIDENIGYAILSAQQVMKIQEQRISFLLGYKFNYTGPEELKYDWGLRAAVTFVFSE